MWLVMNDEMRMGNRILYTLSVGFQRLSYGLGVLFSPYVSADSTTTTSSGALSNTGPVFSQMLGGVVLIIVFLFFLQWLVKRLAPRLPGVTMGNRDLLKIVAGVAVGQRERIVIVEVQPDTWFLVGVAPGSISMLASLPKPIVEQKISDDTGSSMGRGAAQFGDLLRRFSERVGCSHASPKE